MSKHRYTFRGYELNTESHTLRLRGKPVNLRPKTMATLEHLVANGHRIVTKDDLLDAIWPGVDVQEQAVFQSISELRALFGKEPCIETVRGRGYRWIIPLECEAPTRGTRSYPWGRVAAAGFTAIVVSLVWWRLGDTDAALTVLINPSAMSAQSVASSGVTSSIDEMLIQQLRRMGWDARRADASQQSSNELTLDIDVVRIEDGISMDFVLHEGLTRESGSVVSTTPLGAVRDIATELHELLSFRSLDNGQAISLSQLFKRAKDHLDKEDYSTAEAYLLVVLSEFPGHLGAKTTLAYAYQQMGRGEEALALARETHDAAGRLKSPIDRMMSAMLLSRMLSTHERDAESEKLASEALALATAVNDLLIVAEAQEQLGELSIAQGQYARGREQLSFALEYYETFCPSGERRVSERLADLASVTQAAAT